MTYSSYNRRINMLFACLLLALLQSLECAAWTSSPRPEQQPSRRRGRSSGPITPSESSASSSNNPITAQSMLKDGAASTLSSTRKSTMRLSQSVLMESDTLPSFPTAHGLLSPETVMRMEEMAISGGYQSEALVSFLKTYKKHGPLSCLPMLSDPDILPRLTNAMRDCMA